MNARHEEKNTTQRFQWSRWGGPGLALLLLAGAGTYTLVARRAPVGAAPEQSAPPAEGRTPESSTAKAAGSVRAPPRSAPATSAAPVAPQATGAASAPAVALTEAEQAQELAQHREAVRQAARTYRTGRFNAFFREEPFLKEFAQGGPAQLAALKAELSDPAALTSLSADTQFLQNKPEAVLDRMSMIDILYSMAPKDPAARDTMVELLLEPVDRGLPDTAKKGLVGEKYDLLFRLAQLDRQLALDSYARLDSPKMKSLLREALMAGLAESGATMDEVQRLMRTL
ncbi:hypothetical protein [Vitiosangium sp. GDMCC 1.1324]|uniref:hypothetical protein n=1 Tax=Vitiosangium sp. (strain GDMCC 1.1324) TaxID=2138576 RepID=UPI000D3ADFFF|nr:hypothetical protein [Vitiosangium sp. GDMCC 1.1324]PTL75309.1 hypothetical protein DAT35_55740 [Vitiosangium sp. GDMCC 1.1324]